MTDVAATALANGRVCLVGAGPGDPELLTVKAVKRLRSADVVLHDALVSPEVLALVSPSAPLVNVGKRCGTKCITQSEINSLLVSFASEGNYVVRLKSGDPLVFGRAGEEIDALREAGIDVEVVPGVTAAVAAAATAQIPLTDRCNADQVVLVSAHQAAGKAPDWHSVASSRSTILIYMPVEHKSISEGLIRAGLRPSTPCMVISMISQPEQQSYQTTLIELYDQAPLPAPSLLIVGENVRKARIGDLPSFRYELAQAEMQMPSLKE